MPIIKEPFAPRRRDFMSDYRRELLMIDYRRWLNGISLLPCCLKRSLSLAVTALLLLLIL
jgi:hypothetical protein